MKKEFDQLFGLLSDPEFQDPGTGLLFFPAYIFTYDPHKEYEIRKEIKELNSKLERPANYLNSLQMNIFEEFTDFLKESTLGGSNVFDEIINREKEDPEEAMDWLKDEAQSEGFLDYLGQRLNDHFAPQSDKKIYLLINGFGSIYPYLSTSHFLKNTERFIEHFKLILFYPGSFKSDNYSFLGEFQNDNIYKASHLNQLLQS